MSGQLFKEARYDLGKLVNFIELGAQFVEQCDGEEET